MSIAGIDVSTKAIDLVLLDDDGPEATWRSCPLVEGGPWRATRSVRLVFPTRRWFEENGVWLIGMEDPKSEGFTPAKALGMVTGAVLALLPRDIPDLEMPPHEWKLESVGQGKPGKGNAKKDVVAAWAHAEGFAATDWNATDAYAIARAARTLNERAINPAA